jgi:hypothetical protein
MLMANLKTCLPFILISIQVLGKPYGSLSKGQVPKIHTVLSKVGMGPGIPDSIVVNMIGWLNGGKDLSAG